MTDLAQVIGDPAKDHDRVLKTGLANFDSVLFQRDQYHSADEFVLAGQIAADRARRLAATLGTPGWSTIEPVTVSGLALTLPVCRALIGDEPVRVGTGATGADPNVLTFPAAPGSGSRYDLLFLESWVAEVGSVGSADPTSKAIPLAGGVGNPDLAAGGDYAVKNPEIGEETARRLQVRWRLRVVAGVDLAGYPAGVDDPAISAQGDAGGPVAGHAFAALADRGNMYRAGDGSAAAATALGSATGHVWALPCLALLRTAGESALTLDGHKDLRKALVSRVGVPRGITLPILPPGEYTVGAGNGESSVWRQPKLGAGYYPPTVAGADDSTPLSGAFPVFPADFDLPPGWSLSGRLVGTVIRKASASDGGAHTFGLRLRKPSQTYGEQVAGATWTAAAVTDTLGNFVKIQDQVGTFDVPTDGSADGMWVVELYSDQAGPGNWVSGGIYLHLWAETS